MLPDRQCPDLKSQEISAAAQKQSPNSAVAGALAEPEEISSPGKFHEQAELAALAQQPPDKNSRRLRTNAGSKMARQLPVV